MLLTNASNNTCRRLYIVAVFTVIVMTLFSMICVAEDSASPSVDSDKPFRLEKDGLTRAADAIGHPVYAIGRILTTTAKGEQKVKALVRGDGWSYQVIATTSKPLNLPLNALDTVLVVGTSGGVVDGNIEIDRATIAKVSRMRGKLADGDVLYAKTAFFIAPYGMAQTAVAKGKEGLVDIIKTSKVIGVADDNGDYDIFFQTGKADIIGIYTDPTHRNKSMMWVLSLDYDSDDMVMNLGKTKSVLAW